LRITKTILVKVKQVQAQPVLDFTLAEIMQVRLPMPVLGQIFRHVRGQKNMSGIATIQHSLRNIDSRACNIRFFVNVGHSVDRTAVNSHPQPNAQMVLQCSANLERTPHRFFQTMEENQRHPIAGRYSDEFAPCFRSAKAFSAPHDLLQLLQQFNLLVHEQF
jgi:hypothetical protein